MMTTRLRSRAVSADDTRWKREQLGFQCAGFCTGDEIAGVTQCCADQEQARSVPGEHTGDEIAGVTPMLRRSGTGAKWTRPAYRRRDRRRYPDAAPIRNRREAYPASMPATRSPALSRRRADQEKAKRTRPAYRRRDRRRYPDAAPIRNRREAYPASISTRYFWVPAGAARNSRQMSNPQRAATSVAPWPSA